MNKKTSSIKLIALAGLIASIHVIIILIGRLIPGIELFLLIFFPTLTTIYTLHSDIKTLTAYIISVFIITFLIDYNISLLYVLPCLLIGSLFGVLIRLKVQKYYIIIATTLANIILMFFTNFLLQVLYHTDFFLSLKKILGTESNNFIYLLIAIASLSQSLLIYFITEEELKRMGKKLNNTKITYLSYLLPLIANLFILVPNPTISFCSFIITIIFTIPLIPKLYSNNKQIYIIITAQLFSLLLITLPLLMILPLYQITLAYFAPITLGIIIDFAFYIYFLQKEKQA